ncbi:MAG: tetratricopeptide repeat protein, partial [Deltaproteobacteria bacterium]
MAKKQKITRKKLLKEPDEFITTTGRLIRWSRRHQTLLLGVGGAFFIVLIAIVGFRYMANRAENKAFGLISQALATYESRKNTENAAAAYQEVKKEFETVLKKYKHTTAARMAGVVFADLCLKAGDTGRAITLYEHALNALPQESTLT